MIDAFDDLPWHDAVLREIIIDRKKNDVVKLLIQWTESQESSNIIIEFFGCYALQANMHFGIVPPDYILDAACIRESSELETLKKIWQQMGLDISKICCYRITTNSTNSIIDIFSLGFRVINCS